MDPVRENEMNTLEDVGGGWYTNQKQTKINKVNNISNI